MIPLNAGELGDMRAVQTDSMIDQCVIIDYGNSGDNPFGEATETYTDGLTTACSFDPSPTREVPDGSDVVIADATIRLPMTVSLNAKDRVRITVIAGESEVTPLTYEVIGAPQHLKTTLRANLKFIGAL